MLKFHFFKTANRKNRTLKIPNIVRINLSNLKNSEINYYYLYRKKKNDLNGENDFKINDQIKIIILI